MPLTWPGDGIKTPMRRNSKTNMYEFSGNTVCVVDDEALNISVLTEYLEKTGLRVFTAQTGEDALELVGQRMPDIILLDIDMPGIDGFETCRRLKASQNTSAIPVIFMSALEGIKDKLKGFDAGGVDYIIKPFHQDEVLARVTVHLRIRNLQKTLQENSERLQQELLEHEQMARALKNSMATNKAILNAMPDLLLRIRADGTFTNYRATEGDDWGITSSGELIGRDAREVLPPEMLQQVLDSVRQTLQTDTIHTFEFQLERLERTYHYEARSVVSWDDEVMIIIRDITQRKEAEKELLRLNQQLQEANASKDTFFSMIAHDLRGPLNGLLGLSEFISVYIEDFSPQKLKETIGALRTSAKTVYALLDDLLEWSKSQRGVIEYAPQKIDLNKIVNNSMHLFKTNAEHKQITLKSLIREGTTVYADTNMIDTVIRNLISNALKFTAAGGTVAVSVTRHATHAEVAVADTGIGMSAADISKLFRINVKFMHEGTAGEKGTGLGLHLCKDFVEKHDGRIGAESDVGKGTTFSFTLPNAST